MTPITRPKVQPSGDGFAMIIICHVARELTKMTDGHRHCLKYKKNNMVALNCSFVCFSSLLLYIHLRLNNVLFQRSLKHTKHVYFASRKNKICMKNRIFNVSLTQGISLFLWCSKYSCKLFSMLIEFVVRNKKELNFQICSNCLVNIWWSSAAKKRQHPQFSGVVRNVGEKKWLQRKKEGRKRGGWRRGNLSRCALQTMYNF